MEQDLVHTVKTENFEMDYAKFGTGSRPLVLLPGMSLKSTMGIASLVADSYKIFKDDFTVYLFDRKKNFGESYPMDQMAIDTAEAMDSLDIESACFIGISQGGMIAQLIAEKFPQKVERLALGCSASRLNDMSRAVMTEWKRLAESGDVEALCSNFIDKVFSEKTVRKYKKTLMYMNANATEQDMKRFSVLARTCLEFEAYDELSKIKCPTLVLGAELDQTLGVIASREIAETLKQNGVPVELYIYENYGHAAYDEAPDYRSRILEFLKSETQNTQE